MAEEEEEKVGFLFAEALQVAQRESGYSTSTESEHLQALLRTSAILFSCSSLLLSLVEATHPRTYLIMCCFSLRLRRLEDGERAFRRFRVEADSISHSRGNRSVARVHVCSWTHGADLSDDGPLRISHNQVSVGFSNLVYSTSSKLALGLERDRSFSRALRPSRS